MKIALYGRVDNPRFSSLEQVISKLGGSCVVNPNSITPDFELAISLGGDGTFLSAVRKMGDNLVPLLGVNSGRLGFLATVAYDSAEEAVKQVINKNYTLQQRLMINVNGGGIPTHSSRALNEFTIQKSGTSMINIEIEVDSKMVASYWADGVIVSTPTGSTAYSMSVGGAILAPNCDCLIISAIAPHNLNIRPLVLPTSSNIKIKLVTRTEQSAIATIDNREFEAINLSQYTITPCKTKLEEIVLQGSSFYNTLRSKLFWGVDLRN